MRYNYSGKRFKDDVTQFIIESHLTYAELEVRYGISRTVWQKIKDGQDNMTMSTFISVCDAMGKHPKNYFVEFTNREEKK